MSGSLYRVMACAIAIGGAVADVRAHADELLPARTDVAGGRVQSGFSPEGLHFGPWTLSPDVRTEGGYNSNLFGTEANRTGSAYTVLAPSIRLQNDMGLEKIALSANANLTSYPGHSAQDTQEYALRGGAGFELGTLTIGLAASLSRTAERRGTNGTPLSIGQPSLFDSVGQRVDLKRTTGPVSISLSVGHEKLSYSDLLAPNGRILLQDFRDSEQWGVNGRVNFVPSDQSALSLFASYSHVRVPIPNNFENETQSVGGAAAIDTGMFRLTAELGRLHRHFGNPAFKDFSGWVYEAGVEWYPTPLLTVSLGARKGLESSGVATVGSVVSRYYSAEFKYELLRNLAVSGFMRWQDQTFPEIGQSSTGTARQIKGEFSFNRFVALGGYGRNECSSSSVTFTARRFCVTLIGVSVSFRR